MALFLQFLAIFHAIVLAYFILLNGYYLVSSIFAFRSLKRYARRLSSIDVDDLITSAGAPPVTIVMAAYNEELMAVGTVRSCLTLNYPELEVIAVNDGSTDRTLALLTEAYQLVPAARYPMAHIPTSTIRAIYQSQTNPNLWVIDKENGKRADALNAGLNYCRTPLVCVTDADGIIERDALIRVVRPFLEDDRTVAAAGIIRIGNGCKVESSVVRDVRLPKNMLAQLQVVEYLRAFLAGRVGWDAMEIMLLISGAFGLFRRSIIVDVGGFRKESLGEDLDLTVRMHKYCREKGIPYKVTFVPDPVTWTEVPETMRDLGRQRDRWQRGLIDTMIEHRRMLMNPRYGRIGLVAYPYFFFLEMLGVIVEFVGYLVFATVLIMGLASVPFALSFLLVAVVLGFILSVAAVGLEELCFRRYSKMSDLIKLIWLAFAENIFFRQIMTFYRFKGTLSYLMGKKSWGAMERKGLSVSV